MMIHLKFTCLNNHLLWASTFIRMNLFVISTKNEKALLTGHCTPLYLPPPGHQLLAKLNIWICVAWYHTVSDSYIDAFGITFPYTLFLPFSLWHFDCPIMLRSPNPSPMPSGVDYEQSLFPLRDSQGKRTSEWAWMWHTCRAAGEVSWKERLQTKPQWLTLHGLVILKCQFHVIFQANLACPIQFLLLSFCHFAISSLNHRTCCLEISIIYCKHEENMLIAGLCERDLQLNAKENCRKTSLKTLS